METLALEQERKATDPQDTPGVCISNADTTKSQGKLKDYPNAQTFNGKRTVVNSGRASDQKKLSHRKNLMNLRVDIDAEVETSPNQNSSSHIERSPFSFPVVTTSATITSSPAIPWYQDIKNKPKPGNLGVRKNPFANCPKSLSPNPFRKETENDTISSWGIFPPRGAPPGEHGGETLTAQQTPKKYTKANAIDSQHSENQLTNPDEVELHALCMGDAATEEEPNSADSNSIKRSSKRIKSVSPSVGEQLPFSSSSFQNSPMYMTETRRILNDLPLPESASNTHHYGRGENLDKVQFKYGVCASQGQRNSMEDRFCILGGLGDSRDPCSYFGVFDGHGGSSAATFCTANMDKYMLAQSSFPSPAALKAGYIAADEAFLLTDRQRQGRDQLAGSTAITAVSQGNKLFVANVGDSRALVVRRDGTFSQLTVDHRPDDPKERKRVEEAGLSVEASRVNNVLSMSRAIGHKQLKRGVIAEPHVTCVTVGPDDRFLVLATDGLWDFLNNETAALATCCCGSAQHVSERLVAAATAAQSNDDITVLAVELNSS